MEGIQKGLKFNQSTVYQRTFKRNSFYVHTLIYLWIRWLPIALRFNIEIKRGEITITYHYKSFSELSLKYKERRFIETFGLETWGNTNGYQILNWVA